MDRVCMRTDGHFVPSIWAPGQHPQYTTSITIIQRPILGHEVQLNEGRACLSQRSKNMTSTRHNIVHYHAGSQNTCKNLHSVTTDPNCEADADHVGVASDVPRAVILIKSAISHLEGGWVRSHGRI